MHPQLIRKLNTHHQLSHFLRLFNFTSPPKISCGLWITQIACETPSASHDPNLFNLSSLPLAVSKHQLCCVGFCYVYGSNQLPRMPPTRLLGSGKATQFTCHQPDLITHPPTLRARWLSSISTFPFLERPPLHTSSSSQTWGHTLSNQQGEQSLYFLGVTLQHYPQVMELQITILDAGDDKILKAFFE